MEMSRKSRSTALLSTGSYLEVWLLGEIAIIRPDTAIKRNLCPMSGDRIPLMCPELHQALQCKTSDKLQFNT
jgi:hypothetical protein